MAQGRKQFIGIAGQHYLVYALAIRDIHSSLTQGNAPSVDVLASSHDGRCTLAFQVKTSPNAYRRNCYGREGYSWPVGAGVIGKYWESFWYAFIDLQESQGRWNPRVFFVPSQWVAKFVKPSWKFHPYFLPMTGVDLTLERWDVVVGYLSEKPDAIAWANDWPQDRLCEWGD